MEFSMHNCKEVKEQLTELLLDGGDGRAEAVLDQCTECRAEFEALAATLRMTTRLRETVTPNEKYWTGYHAQLREKLVTARGGFHSKAQRLKHVEAQREELKPGLGFVFASLREPLRLCVKTSLLPVPLGLVLIAGAAVIALFAVRAARQPVALPPVVVQVPVEVPVVQEKIVTQVVYRDRRRVSKISKRVARPTTDNALARSQKPQAEDVPITLSGFKPTDEVKLTVIKGGSPNEK
jgi:hypothetical protein